jgi:GH25 family lysozyme M1 (1,4-beta-N-acetylmuramidase)
MLNGFDVSKFNATPSTKGRAFGFVKATEGTAVDPKYSRHSSALHHAGLIAGAYHFGRAASLAPIDAQVRAFLAAAAEADLLALDLEPPSHVRRPDGTYFTPPAMTSQEATAFIAGVHAAGREIGLYHSISGFPRLGQDWNWVADYRNRLAPRFGAPRGLAWRFWQYTSTPYDLDVFAGTRAQLDGLVAASHHR